MLEAASREDSLGKLPFRRLPRRKIRLLVVVFKLLCGAQQIFGNGFNCAAIQIHEVGEVIELHFQHFDNVFELDRRRHRL
jgi:hypothetical protein